MSDTQQPKLCPCCGHKASYTPSNHELRMDGGVECLNPACGLTMEETHSAAPDSALERWNRRSQA